MFADWLEETRRAKQGQDKRKRSQLALHTCFAGCTRGAEACSTALSLPDVSHASPDNANRNTDRAAQVHWVCERPAPTAARTTAPPPPPLTCVAIRYSRVRSVPFFHIAPSPARRPAMPYTVKSNTRAHTIWKGRVTSSCTGEHQGHRRVQTRVRTEGRALRIRCYAWWPPCCGVD